MLARRIGGRTILRGIRGAITVEENTRAAILDATVTLLEEMTRANDVTLEEMVSVLFTLTPDLDQAFPAEAARQLGWIRVPLMCAREVPVPGAMPRVIRVLMLINRDVPLAAIRHVYLGEAVQLRADLSEPGSA
jgi:chorismate mutase